MIEKLRKKGSDASQIFRDDDGDWSEDQLWVAVRFLIQDSRPAEALQVFDLWKNTKDLCVSESSYEKIIGFLSEEGFMEGAIAAFREMKEHNMCPSFEVYNSVICGFASEEKFKEASIFLNEMRGANFRPRTKTYNGLIEAYGKCNMYDEMDMCLKDMESDGCFPDHITYNLLIKGFSRGGLLKRMERMYCTVLSKRMKLHNSTLVAVLEAYASLGILDRMEKVYRWVLKSKVRLKGDLCRKLASVYIENHMFSKLDRLGIDLSSSNGESDLVWCLRLLSHACLLSKNGMYFIVNKMEAEKVPWNITIANTILLAYLKMKDFTHLRILLSELPDRQLKPDMVSLGILSDANMIGFDGTSIVYAWRRLGLFDEAVEMNTDPLVLCAFGKGHFLRSCEDMYCSLEAEDRESKIWNYQTLINLLSKHIENHPFARLE